MGLHNSVEEAKFAYLVSSRRIEIDRSISIELILVHIELFAICSAGARINLNNEDEINAPMLTLTVTRVSSLELRKCPKLFVVKHKSPLSPIILGLTAKFMAKARK